MAFIKVDENNVVIEKVLRNHDGNYIEAPDSVVCGQIKQNDGSFVNSPATVKPYGMKRQAEYPSIGDQLDMIYRNGDGGAEFQAAIKAVKDKYPKE